MTDMEKGGLQRIAARLTAQRPRSIIHFDRRSSHAPTNTATVGVTSTGGAHDHNPEAAMRHVLVSVGVRLPSPSPSQKEVAQDAVHLRRIDDHFQERR